MSSLRLEMTSHLSALPLRHACILGTGAGHIGGPLNIKQMWMKAASSFSKAAFWGSWSWPLSTSSSAKVICLHLLPHVSFFAALTQMDYLLVQKSEVWASLCSSRIVCRAGGSRWRVYFLRFPGFYRPLTFLACGPPPSSKVAAATDQVCLASHTFTLTSVFFHYKALSDYTGPVCVIQDNHLISNLNNPLSC